MNLINKSYVYESDNFSYSFRIFSETESSYHIVTDTFDLFKVSKKEMINNIQQKKIKEQK